MSLAMRQTNLEDGAKLARSAWPLRWRSERRFGWVLLATALLCACGGDDAGKAEGPVAVDVPKSRTPDQETTFDGDAGVGSEADPCKTRKMGASCGEDKFCVGGRCVLNACGDGVKAGTEQCDDGNEAVGDGCDPGCRTEPQGCGNAKVEAGEECDDGNRIDQDACSNDCHKNVCGNQRVDPGEECDDGNRVDADGCTNACTVVRCRNGRVEAGEECDDGDQDDTNGCTNSCKVMVCGNGKREQKEECDDGNSVDNDACANGCTANVCGNMRTDPGEDCDGSLNCDANCKKSSVDRCAECEKKNCTQDANGNRNPMAPDFDATTAFDFYDICVHGKVPANVVADGVTPPPEAFATQCGAVLECSRKYKCIVAPGGAGAVQNSYEAPCFCGPSAPTPDRCTTGPVDGPCVADYLKAASTTDPMKAVAFFSDPSLPLGAADFLLKCDVDYCKAECTPWLVTAGASAAK